MAKVDQRWGRGQDDDVIEASQVDIVYNTSTEEINHHVGELLVLLFLLEFFSLDNKAGLGTFSPLGRFEGGDRLVIRDPQLHHVQQFGTEEAPKDNILWALLVVRAEHH